jgi:hypothetical protein
MGDDLPTDEELDRLQWTTVRYDLPHEPEPDAASASTRGRWC